jgi:lipopolysaccharide/colanic/teichoic acid biosynthesis glycosyltransferase
MSTASPTLTYEPYAPPPPVRVARGLVVHHPGFPGSAVRRAKVFTTRAAWAASAGSFERAKRVLDVVAAAALLVLLSPFLAVVALLIKAYDGGPVLFWQVRVGRFGREFWCPKFRSMVVNADRLKDQLLKCNDHGGDGVTFKMKRDPRVTPVGRFIRKTSVDELPQLWCVLRGDMTLVGPRPPVPREVARYTLAERRRLEVTPGLTCLWQIGGRGDLPFPKQVELDVEYIETRSFGTDLGILIRTVPAVALGRGAY